MTPTSRLLLAAMLATTAIAAPATAKKAEAAAAAAPGAVDAKNISKPVRPVLVEAQKLEAAGDNAGALAQLRTAEAAGNLNSTDIFFISQMKLGLGNKLKDNALLEEAIKASANSEFLPAAEKPKYVKNLAALALQRNDYNAATQYYEQVATMTPNDPDIFSNLAVLYSRQKQNPQAIASLQKAIAATKASGKVPEEALYRTELKIAVDSKLPAQVQSASVELVTAYPNPVNWRDALLVYRDSVKTDDQSNLDFFRLMDAAGALNGERDYAEYVETAIGKGLPGEAKTVLAEGVQKGMLSSSKPYIADYNKSITTRLPADKAGLAAGDKEARAAATGKTAMGQGDAYYGYAEYAKAADMYRLALTKGGIDAGTANLRLGATLARSGDKAGATAALQQVKGAPREQLATYWMIWLGTKA
ncbi:tetratricopeptide repeat protein [Polymorphobacter sp. PAMC 29334]|uniref:tetratricopeptide repeat protein n=1 Tax=Polymorphobacter sp. PAMC 29334 TaxID=2862331 RepID=UPI001C760ED2|nr:tetratricopeptide repeat protein [Polymorphobacter sp. PAMC 29334]QYE34319.1 tetratricopeptide repeat protein [Polymorphobacter sp. PAMC 29334]